MCPRLLLLPAAYGHHQHEVGLVLGPPKPTLRYANLLILRTQEIIQKALKRQRCLLRSPEPRGQDSGTTPSASRGAFPRSWSQPGPAAGSEPPMPLGSGCA